MDTFISIFLRGLAVGLLVSAPMGPVGILCIQRSLSKGRLTGLFTGIGAAISDIIYCLLTGFGLVFIEEFLERNQNIIQLVGSVVLIGFAVWLFRKNPTAGIRSPGVEEGSWSKDMLGGFLFTFSNPLILFLIIGLFARFNFLAPQHKFYHYIVGYIGIAAGAVGWWYVVTYFVDKLRAHFNVRSMWIINRVIGVIILIFAVVGIVGSISSMASANTRGAPPIRLNAEQLIGPREREALPWSSSVAVMLPGRIRWTMPAGTGTWNLRLKAPEGDAGSGLLITASREGGKDSDPLYSSQGADRPVIRIRVSNPGCGAYVEKIVDASGWERNTLLRWEMTRDGDGWQLRVGSGSPKDHLSFSGGTEVGSLSFSSSDSRMWIGDLSVSSAPGIDDVCAEEYIQTVWEDSCELEGLWQLYDWSVDDSLAELGGEYVVRLEAVDGGYEILYLSGARLYPSSWKSGRLKGRLVEEASGGSYRLAWIDAEGDALSAGKAEMVDGLLVLHMPRRHAELRFRRISL